MLKIWLCRYTKSKTEDRKIKGSPCQIPFLLLTLICTAAKGFSLVTTLVNWGNWNMNLIKDPEKNLSFLIPSMILLLEVVMFPFIIAYIGLVVYIHRLRKQ